MLQNLAIVHNPFDTWHMRSRTSSMGSSSWQMFCKPLDQIRLLEVFSEWNTRSLMISDKDKMISLPSVVTSLSGDNKSQVLCHMLRL